MESVHVLCMCVWGGGVRIFSTEPFYYDTKQHTAAAGGG